MDEQLETIFRCPICKELPAEPVLLECLHSCCRPCVEQHQQACASGATALRCPACQLDSPVMAGDGVNSFASAKLRVAAMCTGDTAPECDLCPVTGRSGKALESSQEHATWWCNQCCQALCETCLCQHKSNAPTRWHDLLPLSDARRLEKAAVPALAAMCSAHGGRKCELVCLDCKAPGCSDCFRDCAGRHKVEHAVHGSGRGKELVDGVAREVRAELQAVRSAAAGLAVRKSLAKELQSARRAGTEELQRNKRVVLKVVDEVFLAAQCELAGHYDELDEQAAAASAAAEPLEAGAGQGTAYAACLLDADDSASLLRLREPLLASLRALKEQLCTLPAVQTDGAHGCVSIESAFPDNMAAICRSWIGVPTRRSDILASAGGAVVTGTCAPGSHEHSGTRHDQAAASLRPPNGTRAPTPSASPYSSSSSKAATAADSAEAGWHIESPVECLDLAISADGRSLLLAAAEHGLRELDASCGAELSVWTCPMPSGDGAAERVTAVDALQDGRAAVGLRNAQCVVLLARDGGGAWQQDGRVIDLQSRPLRIAVHSSDLLAAAESFPSQLVLVSLLPAERRLLLLRQKWDYVIGSLAVTDQAVVTAGLAKTTLFDGREGYPLECYAHSGERLWRQLRSAEVIDLCVALGPTTTSPEQSPCAAPELYVLIKGGDAVVVLQSDDGQRCADVIVAGVGTEPKPQLQRLSICTAAAAASPTALAAALASDWKSVVLLRFVRSASVD